MLALDQPARDVFGNRLHDLGNLMRFSENPAPDARVVQKSVSALVAPHRDVRDGIDP